MIKFFHGHYCFSEIWRYLGKSRKCKILDVLPEGKGIIAYEKNSGHERAFLVSENEVFFEKADFYSDLKQK